VKFYKAIKSGSVKEATDSLDTADNTTESSSDNGDKDPEF